MRRALVNIASSDSVVAATPYGFDLRLPAWDHGLLGALLTRSILDDGVSRAFTTLLRPGDSVIDGGAHVGYFTLLAASLVGDGQVLAFEPRPEVSAWLRVNVAGHKGPARIDIVEAALAATDGTATFWVSEDISTNSSLAEERGQTPVEVPTRALDGVGERPLAPTLIKLDLEGGEVLAMRGMPRTLQSTEWLILEINEASCVSSERSPRSCSRTRTTRGASALPCSSAPER